MQILTPGLCKSGLTILIILLFGGSNYGQDLSDIKISDANGYELGVINGYEPDSPLPLFSLRINDTLYSSLNGMTSPKGTRLEDLLDISYSGLSASKEINLEITFQNISVDTLRIHNVVPLGESSSHVYITGYGNHYLSRSHLFRPGYEPVNVILPDNAWELGFTAMKINPDLNVAALARRNPDSVVKGSPRRFETLIYPGGSVTYDLWLNRYQGEWQNGLEKIFRERMIYDVEPEAFDNTLFERDDLKWIRHAYVSHLLMAWDHHFYDYESRAFGLEDFLTRGKQLYGGDDFIGLWPTWPTLGIDQRNQWDLFRDLPGGTQKLQELSEMLENKYSALFICYNPWDESTRMEDHLGGMAEMIKRSGARGVVLDTRGESSRELQEAADSIRSGVIMYSEGMAIPEHMQGIIAGRVHNALYYCPLLNLNKFIKPEFAIFRVAEIYKEPIKREFCTSFFNGYGTELNIFAPGKPPWIEEQYLYLGRTSRILRENTTNFVSGNYTPLIPTTRDSIWVNRWTDRNKIIYTIYSTIPEGYKGLLFNVDPAEGYHYVDLWHHKLLKPVKVNDGWVIEAATDAFNASWLGTNNEGEVDCIARLPVIIHAEIAGDELRVDSSDGSDGSDGIDGSDEGFISTFQTSHSGLIQPHGIYVWAGEPGYAKDPLVLPAGRHRIRLLEKFGRYEGKFVIQLFENGILKDETIQEIIPGTPRPASYPGKTLPAAKKPDGMVRIPAGKFTFRATNGDEFIPYPEYNQGMTCEMSSFYMDRYPVTNAQFNEFIQSTGYHPADTVNFLKHWKDGKIIAGQEEFPVVNISWEDAKAYATWAGKRLPTEVEWQYAAQTSEGNEWPWHQDTPVERIEEPVTPKLTVYRIKGIDPGFCNTGTDRLYPVGTYPKGVNPFGLEDLVGCVWQLTNDLYVSGSYRYIIMKGGSCFNPSGSWWYVQGGPRELHYRQYLLRVSEGFERNGTVGFRCVMDMEQVPGERNSL